MMKFKEKPIIERNKENSVVEEFFHYAKINLFKLSINKWLTVHLRSLLRADCEQFTDCISIYNIPLSQKM